MGRTVVAEDNILKLLTNISTYPGVSVGIIIGQSSNQKDYIVHIAPTPSLSKSTAKESLKEIDEVTLSDHARFVTRALPGGLWVLGIFVICPDDILGSSSDVKILRRLVNEVDKNLGGGFFLDGLSPSEERLILHFNPTTNLYVCKSLDRSFGSTIKPVDWKFQSFTQSWCKINTEYNFVEVYVDITNTVSIKDQFQEVTRRLRKDIDESRVIFDGEVRDDSKAIESVMKQNPTKSVDAALLHSFPIFTENADIKLFSSNTELHVSGVIPSIVFINPRASLEEASRAVKQDIVRSLGARIELHWDSLVDEDGGYPEEQERLHELPRRVLLQPTDWHISLADYLFPGEGAKDAVNFCRDMLDIDLTEDAVTQVETPPDTTSFLMKSTEGPQGNEKSSFSSTYIIIAVAIFIIAFLLQFLLK